MNKGRILNSEERVPFSLFHAAVEREKNDTKKQLVKKPCEESEGKECVQSSEERL